MDLSFAEIAGTGPEIKWPRVHGSSVTHDCVHVAIESSFEGISRKSITEEAAGRDDAVNQFRHIILTKEFPEPMGTELDSGLAAW